MGELVLTAKVSHVPTMLLSERPGRLYGTRDSSINAHREIGRRARALGADTVVVLDTHWMVNAGYHVNSNAASRAPTPATNSRSSSRGWTTTMRAIRRWAT